MMLMEQIDQSQKRYRFHANVIVHLGRQPQLTEPNFKDEIIILLHLRDKNILMIRSNTLPMVLSYIDKV